MDQEKLRAIYEKWRAKKCAECEERYECQNPPCQGILKAEIEDLEAELNDLKPTLVAKTILLNNIRKRLEEGTCDACRRLREDLKWATGEVSSEQATVVYAETKYDDGTGEIIIDNRKPKDPPKKKSRVPKKLKCGKCGLVIETLTDVDNIKVCEKCGAHWSYAPVELRHKSSRCPTCPKFNDEVECDGECPIEAPPKPTIEDFQSPYEMGEDGEPYSMENLLRLTMSCARCANCHQYTCPVPNAVNQDNPRKKKG